MNGVENKEIFKKKQISSEIGARKRANRKRMICRNINNCVHMIVTHIQFIAKSFSFCLSSSSTSIGSIFPLKIDAIGMSVYCICVRS